MAKSTPNVARNKLFLNAHANALYLCDLDSSEWFDWVESATHFRYQTTRQIHLTHGFTRPMRPISLRKEKRRRGFLWYANLRVHGTLYKRYVGRSCTLTIERLDLVASILNEIW